MRARRAVEIRGSTIPVLQIVVRDCDPGLLEEEMTAAVGKARRLLDDAVAVLDLRERHDDCMLPGEVIGAARSAGVRLAAVLVRGEAESALLAGADLPVIEAPAPNDSSVNAVSEAAISGSPGSGDPAPEDPASEDTAPENTGSGAQAPQSEGADTPPCADSGQPAALGPPAPLCIAQPLRSGQRVYAQGRDLIVLAPTSRGAELIADGSIYAFAPLRGRALAGASGDKGAAIIATILDAELVSIAGVYRTLEPADLHEFGDGAVRVALAFDPEGSERLVLRPVGQLPSFS